MSINWSFILLSSFLITAFVPMKTKVLAIDTDLTDTTLEQQKAAAFKSWMNEPAQRDQFTQKQKGYNLNADEYNTLVSSMSSSGIIISYVLNPLNWTKCLAAACCIIDAIWAQIEQYGTFDVENMNVLKALQCLSDISPDVVAALIPIALKVLGGL